MPTNKSYKDIIPVKCPIRPAVLSLSKWEPNADERRD